MFCLCSTFSLVSCKKETSNTSHQINTTSSTSTTTTKSGYGESIKDADGNIYKTIYIGSQQWMAENLKTTKYNDGTRIPNEFSTDIDTIGLWTDYLFRKTDTINRYGGSIGQYYNWYSIDKKSNGNKNVCPTGWHVPSIAEWQVLIDFLGGSQVAGGKMKLTETTLWDYPNAGATNSSLFSAVGSGRPHELYDLDHISTYLPKTKGKYCTWWSISDIPENLNEFCQNCISTVGLSYDQVYVSTNMPYSKESFLSIRCLKD
jgi:uncharacterized protein (TIGR02145 family)